MSHNNPQAGLSHLSQGCSSSKATPNRLTWSEHDPGPKWSQLVTSLGTHCISTRANHMSLTPWATPLVICLLISWRLITTGSQWVSFSYPNNPNIPACTEQGIHGPFIHDYIEALFSEGLAAFEGSHMKQLGKFILQWIHCCPARIDIWKSPMSKPNPTSYLAIWQGSMSINWRRNWFYRWLYVHILKKALPIGV